jgi:OmpA-OmpF porin, OOP family
MRKFLVIACVLIFFQSCVTSYKQTVYTRMSSNDMIFYPVILFDTGEAKIKSESFSDIARVAQILNKYTYLNLSIEGHTDSEGDPDFNNALSEKRALSVKKELIKLGIDPIRLATKGWGASKPLITNDSHANQYRNRRVEFVRF